MTYDSLKVNAQRTSTPGDHPTSRSPRHQINIHSTASGSPRDLRQLLGVCTMRVRSRVSTYTRQDSGSTPRNDPIHLQPIQPFVFRSLKDFECPLREDRPTLEDRFSWGLQSSDYSLTPIFTQHIRLRKSPFLPTHQRPRDPASGDVRCQQGSSLSINWVPTSGIRRGTFQVSQCFAGSQCQIPSSKARLIQDACTRYHNRQSAINRPPPHPKRLSKLELSAAILACTLRRAQNSRSHRDIEKSTR